MRISDRFLALSGLGSEWVLYLLLGLSVLSVTIMVERGISMRASVPDFDALTAKLQALLSKGNLAGAREALGPPKSPEVRVALAGLGELPRGRDGAAEVMASAKARERMTLERNLGVLGTLGNNTPFIGLFGTVLGIMRSFADLSKNQTAAQTQTVMAGISEALVATAVGLMVAIPAVIFFNIFQGRLRRMMGRVDTLAHLVLSSAPETVEGERTAARG